ncbi:MAG: hypothetical protein HYU67_10090 [Flavobacteriia bacterium]|nr:hypothetical protein [Flavobacteriia bacterium]
MIANQSFNGLLENLSNNTNITDFLFVYYGKMNQDLIVSAIHMLENKLIIENFAKTLISKAKIISIEMLQNIVKHQQVHPEIFPYFIVGIDKNSLVFFSGNVVNTLDKEVICKNMDKLKLLKNSNIKENYKYALKNTTISSEGNAGIGLLDIVYRSGNQVNYHFDEFNNQIYTFNLQVLLN